MKSPTIKNNKKNLIKEKYLYYIPCYDIINNEIFFSEYFTEKIITKQKKIKKVKNKRKESSSLETKLPIFLTGKYTRKVRMKEQKRKNNIKDSQTVPKVKSLKKGFRIFGNRSEVTSNYTYREINKIKNDKKKLINKEKIMLEKFALNWKKMKIISGFNENNYLSENYIQYFSRPIFNKFFYSQNLNLYSFNSTLPLSKTMSDKSFINIYIQYDI